MPQQYGTTGVQALTSAPAVGPEGATYWNSTANKLYVSIDGAWVQFAPVPAGGGTDQVLAKSSSTDYALTWMDIPDDTPTNLTGFPGSWVKEDVIVATTTNILLTGLQTIDGVALDVGHRVLVKDQSTASTNGIYLVSTSVWTRAPDADAAPEIASAQVGVDWGAVNGGTRWGTSFKATDTLGSTPMTWVDDRTGIPSAHTHDAGDIITGTLPVARGGTNGTAVPTAGGIGYGNGSALAYTGAGTAGQVLTSSGAGAPTWAAGGGGNLVVSSTNPGMTAPGLWVEITDTGEPVTFWIEDGL